MDKIFLTGGNGFIGKNFCETFANKYFIDAPQRSQLELTDSKKVDDYLAQKKFDFIIHAASTNTTRNNQKDNFIALNENTRLFANVFKHRNNCQRFVFISSGAAYGLPLAVERIDEGHFEKTVPEDGYGFAKFLCSRMIESESPQKALSLHLFGIFGAYEDYGVKFISNSILRVLNNAPIILENPDIRFDYLYVKDCIRIIEQFLLSEPTHSFYNVSSGTQTKLIEIAEIIYDVLGKPRNITANKSGSNISYTANNDRLLEFLGKDFKFTPLRSAIEELASSYEKKLSFFDKKLIINATS